MPSLELYIGKNCDPQPEVWGTLKRGHFSGYLQFDTDEICKELNNKEHIWHRIISNILNSSSGNIMQRWGKVSYSAVQIIYEPGQLLPLMKEEQCFPAPRKR